MKNAESSETIRTVVCGPETAPPVRGRELRDPRRGGGRRDSDAEAEDEASPEEHGAVLRRRDNGRADKDDAAPYGHSGAATEVVAPETYEGPAQIDL